MSATPDPSLVAELRQRLLVAFEAENRRPATVEEYELIAARAVAEASAMPPPPPVILPEGAVFRPPVRSEPKAS